MMQEPERRIAKPTDEEREAADEKLEESLGFGLMTLEFLLEKLSPTIDEAVSIAMDEALWLVKDYGGIRRALIPSQLKKTFAIYKQFRRRLLGKLINYYGEEHKEEIIAEFGRAWRQSKFGSNRTEEEIELFKKMKEHVAAHDKHKRSSRVSNTASGQRMSKQDANKLNSDFLGNFEEIILSRYLEAEPGEFRREEGDENDQAVEHYLLSVLGTIKINYNFSEEDLERYQARALSIEDVKIAVTRLYNTLPEFFEIHYPNEPEGDLVWQTFIDRAVTAWTESSFMSDIGWCPDFIIDNNRELLYLRENEQKFQFFLNEFREAIDLEAAFIHLGKVVNLTLAAIHLDVAMMANQEKASYREKLYIKKAMQSRIKKLRELVADSDSEKLRLIVDSLNQNYRQAYSNANAF